MRYILPLVLLLAFTLSIFAGKIDDQIVTPYVEVNGCGSGVCITQHDQLYILTAAHVVEDARQIVAKTNGEKSETWKPLSVRKYDDKQDRRWKCDMIAYSPPVSEDGSGGNDLALLKPKQPEGLTPAKFAADVKLRTGQTIWYIGSPCLVHASLEKSIINKLDEEAWHRSGWLMFNGNGTYGSSGGPVFAKHKGDYYVVGITAMFRQVSDNTKSPLLAVPHTKIAAFLEAALEK